MHISQQQEQFSRAYVHAIASVAGFTIYTPQVDDDSVDLGIAQTGGRGTIRSPRLTGVQDLSWECWSPKPTGVQDLSWECWSPKLKLWIGQVSVKDKRVLWSIYPVISNLRLIHCKISCAV